MADEQDSMTAEIPSESQKIIMTYQDQSLIAENAQFSKWLDEAADELKKDFGSGARRMADSALETLSRFIRLAAALTASRNDLWRMAVHAAIVLSEAGPSMSAAITSCLLGALDKIGKLWDSATEKEDVMVEGLVDIAELAVKEMVEKRKGDVMVLGHNFVLWVEKFLSELPSSDTRFQPVTILTLSNSSTIRLCIHTLLTSVPNLYLTFAILESRPRFEGTDMASQILSSLPQEHKTRLHIHILPDCAMATAAKNANIVLLCADRISATGDVSNKIGSVAAAVLARTLNQQVKVVVLSDVDKIVAPGALHGETELHPKIEVMGAWGDKTRRDLEQHGEGVEVFGEWFEWVPARFVDKYITEMGVLNAEGIQELANKVGELKGRIFVEGHAKAG